MGKRQEKLWIKTFNKGRGVVARDSRFHGIKLMKCRLLAPKPSAQFTIQWKRKNSSAPRGTSFETKQNLVLAILDGMKKVEKLNQK